MRPAAGSRPSAARRLAGSLSQPIRYIGNAVKAIQGGDYTTPLPIVDDTELDHSYLNKIEATPTLIRFVAGQETERVMGWDRAAWQRLTGINAIGASLPPLVPG